MKRQVTMKDVVSETMAKTYGTHDPGTHDALLTRRRLEGRMAFRENPEQPPAERQSTEWWLGWYDERLKRFFGRA